MSAGVSSEGSAQLSGQVRAEFRPMSGRLTAILALIAAGVLLIFAVTMPQLGLGLAGACVAVLVALLAWSSMLYPKLSITDRHLVLRNMLETVQIPLAAIEQVAVRQVLAVRVGEKRFVSTVVGRSLRGVIRGPHAAPGPKPASAMDHVDLVESRIRSAAESARAQTGIELMSAEQEALAQEVRRTPCWPVIAPILITLVLLAVTLVA